MKIDWRVQILFSDTKTREDLANRFFIGTSFLVKPKDDKKSEQDADEYFEMPPTPNINDLYDDSDESAWVIWETIWFIYQINIGINDTWLTRYVSILESHRRWRNATESTSRYDQNTNYRTNDSRAYDRH